MPGSDFDRPGLTPRANLNIGIGHTFGFLKKDPIGDEVTVAYTDENAGSHGFFHTDFGSHTEALGAAIHFNDHNSVWIQESYNKMPTVPWYTTTGIGYTWSW